MFPLAQMPDEHRHEVRVALGCEHCDAVSDDPQRETGKPLPKPEPKRCSDGAIENGDRPRRTAKKDGLDQSAMDRRFEAFGMGSAAHEIRAPPPKLKKDRKKEEAAKAIDSPKMIWISRLNPPAVSPKASVRPVVMMMITATILATGPWTDSRTFCSGSSQGIPEPAASASVAASIAAANSMLRAARMQRIGFGTGM